MRAACIPADVVKYAKDNELFLREFTKAYTKLTELGTKNLKAVDV